MNADFRFEERLETQSITVLRTCNNPREQRPILFRRSQDRVLTQHLRKMRPNEMPHGSTTAPSPSLPQTELIIKTKQQSTTR